MTSSSQPDQSPVITVHELGKCYQIYNNPRDRLKQAIVGQRRKYYREFWALRHVNFTSFAGETIGVIGRNGSGKSTLLQLICGTLTPTEGQVETRGTVAALLELGSGFNPEFTGIENLYLAGSLIGMKQSDIDAKLDDILSFADIGSFINQPLKTYSSGMQLRLAFALITQSHADILIVDEALAVGDAVFVQRCMRFINTFRATGTLFFVSHDPGSVATLTDRCLWLVDGELRENGVTREVLQHYNNFCQQKSGTQISNDSGVKQGQDLGNLDGSPNIDDKSRLSIARPTHSPCLEHPALNAKGPGDFRQPLINSGVLEMSYKIIHMPANDSSASHQDGRCEVGSISFIDHEGSTINSLRGGSIVTLLVICLANKEIKSPIVGFAIIDRRGLTIFGENTYGSGRYAEETVAAGESFTASFTMEWPWLASGDYSLTIAVASGNRLSHVNHCWLNECMIISATPETKLANGVFSPSFLKIDLLKLGD